MKRWDIKRDSVYLGRCIIAALGVLVAMNTPMVKLPVGLMIPIFMAWFGLCLCLRGPWIAICVTSLLAGSSFFCSGVIALVSVGFATYALANDLVTPIALLVLSVCWVVFAGWVIKSRITKGRPYLWETICLIFGGAVIGYWSNFMIAAWRASNLKSPS